MSVKIFSQSIDCERCLVNDTQRLCIWFAWTEWSRQIYSFKNDDRNPSSQIFFDGHPWSRKDLSDIGALIETPPVYENLSAWENLKVRAMILGLPDERISEALELVDLCDTGKKKAGAFSLGMKQRLGIAQALLTRPKLLICDEPTSALDPVGRKEILDILRKISSTTTVLFSTHILSDVERICDHAALLNQGKIVVGGTLSEIKALHGHESLLLEFPTDDALHTFKSQEAIQPLLDTAEANGKEIILHSQEMEKVQHTVFHVLAETALCPIKIEIMEPSLESLFLEVIK